ncbi:MAG: two-component system CheB/CheR fusion protein [Saprospiraceae bacterium]|jgi:two-component system CheB/CheR fusion protein
MKNKNEETSKNLKIVGIGASASGLQALEVFFSNCSSDSGLSYVVIQHLSPDFKSMHSSLLARKTKIPISVAEEGMDIVPNHIYLIPGKKNIIIKDDKLRLLSRAPAHEINLPINIFLISLAEEKKSNAVGVILSGTGSDGTKGAAAIKEVGGIVFAQNPSESGFSGMPLSVINADLADFIINVAEIPGELYSYFNYASRVERKEAEIVVDDILEILREETKYDFSAYRKQTLNRRILKRKNINKLDKLSDYKDFLEKTPDEQDILVSEFLIGVTSFFRDTAYFRKLQELVIPELIAKKEKGGVLKLWVIGCVTGEEAYSLAILLKEGLKDDKRNLDFKIFATDINVKAITKASKGFFGQNIVSDVPPEHLATYFKRKDNGFVVQDHLRKHIVFSNHDILHNPPFNKMDLISCRNLLIYFQDSAQERAIKSILYALNLNGYLFLGSSESLGSFSKYFAVIDHRAKIYNKKLEYDSNSNTQDIFSTKIDRLPSKKLPEFASELTVQFTKKLAIVTDSVCICVNENIQVLEVYGSLRLIGTLPFEGFSTNLLRLLPKEFHVPVSTAIRTLSKSTKEIKAITKLVSFRDNDKILSAKLIFDRFDQRAYPHEKFYLIAIKVEEPLGGTQRAEPLLTVDTSSNAEIQQLQNLLEDTRENLQLTIEELESSNEEAQATNEELVSSNEELQSTNEELQSVNEELYTVNAELQEKNIQLMELNSDIENLINSSHIATLFLDERLHIRRFTPSIRGIIDLRESDIDRSITNFSLPNKSFLNDVKTVSQSQNISRKEVFTNSDKWFLQEIHSYVSSDEKTKGTVINYTDITGLKQGIIDIEEQSKILSNIFDLIPGYIFIINLEEQRIVYSNPSIQEMVGYSREEIIKMGSDLLPSVVHPVDLIRVQEHFEKVKTAKENEINTIQMRWISRNKEIKKMESTDKPFEMNADGTVKTILSFGRIMKEQE